MLGKMCFGETKTRRGKFFRGLFIGVGFFTVCTLIAVSAWLFSSPVMINEVQASETTFDGKYIVSIKDETEDSEKGFFTWHTYYVVPQKVNGTEFKNYQDSIATSYQLGRLDFLTVAITVLAALGAMASFYGAVEVRKKAIETAETAATVAAEKIAEKIAQEIAQETLDDYLEDKLAPMLDRELFMKFVESSKKDLDIENSEPLVDNSNEVGKERSQREVEKSDSDGKSDDGDFLHNPMVD